MKFLSFVKTNLKFLIPTMILIIVVAGYFIFFFDKVGVSSDTDTEFIDFAKNYKFIIPEGYYVNPNGNQKTVIITSKDVKQYRPNDYAGLMKVGAILIQAYTQLNENDEIFEKYIREQYKSDEQKEIEFEFEEINHKKVVTINANYLNTAYREYVKIINLRYPVLITSPGPSIGLSSILKSITDCDEQDQDYRELNSQIRLIGALLKVNMTKELYSLFTESYKEEISAGDLIIILQRSEKLLSERSINFIGGNLDKKTNEFSIELLLMHPEIQGDKRAVKLKLKKEEGQWLIDEMKLPEDERENAGQ